MESNKETAESGKRALTKEKEEISVVDLAEKLFFFCNNNAEFLPRGFLRAVEGKRNGEIYQPVTA